MKLFSASIVTILALTAVGVFHGLTDEQNYEQRLQNIASLVNSQNLGWGAELSPRFRGMTKSEIKHMMGTIPIETLNLPSATDVQELDLSDLPESFSSEAKWPECQSIKDIRDQANCGSCWAFGAVEAMSDRICISGYEERADKVQTRLSAEDLLTCCNKCGMGCGGGYVHKAWEYFSNKGIVTGWFYGNKEFCSPYEIHPCTKEYPKCSGTAMTPGCKEYCIPGYPKSYDDDLHYGNFVYVVKYEKVMMAEMIKNGPFEVAFNVYEDFMTYKSGVYWHKHGNFLGLHAAKIYWVWSSGWGEVLEGGKLLEYVVGDGRVCLDSEGSGRFGD